MEKQNIIYAGSHPDSLYRVSGNNGGGAGKAVRALRVLRWPLALFTVCVALAVFVYFLMPVNVDTEIDTVNATFWEESIPEAQSHSNLNKIHVNPTQHPVSEKSHSHGTKTPEIDFYDSDIKNYDLTSIVDIVTEISEKRKLPAPPVFPTYIAPEVQYGNEKADSDQPRSPKLLKVTTTVPSDSTLKPHITQKPEKPLAIYFKEGNALSTVNTEPPITESITHAETSNDIAQFLKQQGNKNILDYSKPPLPTYRDIQSSPALQKFNQAQFKQNFEREQELSPEVQEYNSQIVPNNNVKFTSGHSMLFGISIEDAQNMKSTTQNSLYNTRVSPTLPTWRDRDDATTKKYPISGNFDVPQCRSTHIDICRGVLPYDLAGAPATVGDVEVTTLLPQIEYLVGTNCSQRIRHFACALLEPECSPPPYSPKLPCYNFCKAIVDSCDGMIPTELQQMFDCNRYSSSNCANARVPCFTRELACGDGSCVPRDWVCDGTRDCAGGEDEAPCASCEVNEYRCSSGLCITKRWLCDGYSDCPNGEDELEELCSRRISFQGAVADEVEVGEPGEEIAGSAPAPSIRKPNRLIDHERGQGIRNGENDSSKEILMTSDSNNAFRRNFTRRPSPSRLTPYKRPKSLNIKPTTESEEIVEETTTISIRKITVDNNEKNKPNMKNENNNQMNANKDSTEDVNAEDLGLFGDIEKEKTDNKEKVGMQQNRPKPNRKSANIVPGAEPTRLDKTMNNLERVIDGAAMIRKATTENQEKYDSPEVNITMEKIEGNMGPYNSAHASPCPSGELRCVDGRCITLAQLCDGTIDCSDHADEDNCFT